jgi:hypothetical protein
MGFNIKNNYGPNIEVNDGGVVHLHQDRSGHWTTDIEEAQIVEDIAAEEGDGQCVEQRVKNCIEALIEEKVLKNLYDYTWVMEAMNQTDKMPKFNSPQSFINYLENLGVKRLPSEDSIEKKQGKFTGSFPEWEFVDCDATEATRRINVGKRFLSLYRRI